MQIGIHIETFNLEPAAVVLEKVAHQPGVEITAKDNCGFDPDSKR
jgi:hypothetical protein